MGKLLAAAGLAALLAAAFMAGRYQAPTAPTLSPRVPVDDPLFVAWEEFLQAQQASLSLFRESPFFEDDQERAEAYRGLLYSLVDAIETTALTQQDRPRFVRAADWRSKGGLDNPDNNYYVARLRPGADYRVSGSRGSSAQLALMLRPGPPVLVGATTPAGISALHDAEIERDAAGLFEVVISAENPGEGINWLPRTDGAEFLVARYTYSDWAGEQPGSLRIERIGAEGEAAVPLTPTLMAKGLRDAADALYQRNVAWRDFVTRLWEQAPRNSISAAQPRDGGLPGHYMALGSWELGNDDAIVLSTAPSAASYQGIQLGNLWFASLDYESRVSSLSLGQMECSGDGRCYAVISHRDPGIRNWLDTEGHRRGLIVMRWQGLDGPLPADQQPGASLVPFAELRARLPADVAEFSREQRWEQIRERRASAQSRSDG